MNDGVFISGDREISQAGLNARADKVAGGLSRLGIGEDDTVALFLRNDFAFVEAAIGVNKLGGYLVPINWHFTAAEAEHVLSDCQAKVLIVHTDLLDQVREAIPKGVQVILVDTPEEIRAAYAIPEKQQDFPQEYLRWEPWLQAQSAWSGQTPPLRNNIIYTSGTTGKPKGVRREPAVGKIAERIRHIMATSYGIVQGEPIRTVITGPMYHSVPNVYGLTASRALGSLVVMQPRFNAVELLQFIERYKITHLHMVPTMFIRLLALDEEVRQKYDLSSLVCVAHGAAPCPPEVKRKMIEWWGPIINEYYGASETGPAVFHTSEEALQKPGTVGRPVETATVKIYDDDGCVLPPGEVGDVYLRIKDYPDFDYLNKPGAKVDMLRDGLVTAGDMGYLDEDGYLFLCDRRNDMIISGGVNIYPAEIEAAISSLNGVKDSAVFGVPHPEFGETVCAHIEVKADCNLDEVGIKAGLGAHLASYKIPRKIVFEESLPREDSGKIFKKKLRALYQ